MAKENIDLKGFLVMVLVTFLWGFNYTVIKFGAAGLSPVFMSFLRSVIASALGIVYCLAFSRQTLFHRDIRLFHGFMVGLLFALEFVCLYFGIIFTHAARAGILINLSPFVVVIGAYIFLNERIGLTKVVGLVLASAGAYFVLREKPVAWNRSMLFGDALAIAAAVFWGATTVYIKKYLADRVHPINTFLYQLVFSIPIILLCAFILEPKWIMHIDSSVVASVAYQSVIVAFASFLIWFKMIHNYPVSQLAVFTFLSPIFGVASGVVILHEPYTASLIFGLFLVCCGIYVTNCSLAKSIPK